MDLDTASAENVLNLHFSMESYTYITSESISADVLRQKYLENRLSMRDIAKEFMCSKTQVRNLLLKHEIPLREPSKYHKDHSRSFGKRQVNGEAVDHKKELRIIETIKGMREEGMTARAIARTLDTMKIPTKKQGKGWHHHMVITILKREGFYETKCKPGRKK
ncbi:MAG: hypothetical protein CL675_05530 [Bdellovibrionaceae bacterium]|nr:hypothetical protein [Pseudobdellovibrionaceae bacterium]